MPDSPSQPLELQFGHVHTQHAQNPAHVPTSALLSPTLSPDVSSEQPMSPAYYGVVIYMLSLASWMIYLAWAFLPEWILHAVGITYYPDRWWALAIPAWGVVTVAFVALYTQLHVLYYSPDTNSVAAITDSFATVKVSDSYDLHDLPLHEVSLNLHRTGRHSSTHASQFLANLGHRNRGHTVT
ncbi:PIG-P-domain-containing protein [Catenaria anguillulae PL171]|uniref:PIG-P-domain-containing protein n=1 Tax=Catenaria anguillulae PL171 TaxID=765915 RepID=A0A1Y2HY72_9FUNG|nr:PIG-P-domain-containing protein [Catenaria anguillulae PL171]